jgi:hypothetical protein
VNSKALYSVDPNELPRYSVLEAAKYLRMPNTTLKSWVSGRRYPVASEERHWEGLIHRPSAEDPRPLVLESHRSLLINVSRGGQEAMPEILQAYLERIEWKPQDRPVRMFPLTRDDPHTAPRLVMIDSVMAFGRPALEAFEVEEALRYEALALGGRR